MSTAVPVDYEGLLKLFGLFEEKNVKLLEFSHFSVVLFFFARDTRFGKTHNANVKTS